jgi:outer membrane protein OmpA-like peptidoglycan-associated protein
VTPLEAGARIRRALLAGLVLCSVTPAVLQGGSMASARAADAQREAQRLPPLELRIDPADVLLSSGQLTARLSRPAARLTLKVLGLSGTVLAEVEQKFDGSPAGAPLVLRWQPPAERVARLELFGYDTSGYYKGIAITPWSFEIPHEDVSFATDSAKVEPREEKKLAASLALIEKELPRARHLGQVTLYILAHTDTVGSAAYNLRLSTERARSIGRWFKTHGLRIPMAYDGVGEAMLKVETADEVDEPRNRSVDYMLGVEPPRFEKTKTSPLWKQL